MTSDKLARQLDRLLVQRTPRGDRIACHMCSFLRATEATILPRDVRPLSYGVALGWLMGRIGLEVRLCEPHETEVRAAATVLETLGGW